MSNTNADQPAYPVEIDTFGGDLRGVQTNNTTGWAVGLTKREAFAMVAMQGLLANGHFASELEQLHETQPTGSLSLVEFLTKSAVVYADSLLTSLESLRK